MKFAKKSKKSKNQQLFKLSKIVRLRNNNYKWRFQQNLVLKKLD